MGGKESCYNWYFVFRWCFIREKSSQEILKGHMYVCSNHAMACEWCNMIKYCSFKKVGLK